MSGPNGTTQIGPNSSGPMGPNGPQQIGPNGPTPMGGGPMGPHMGPANQVGGGMGQGGVPPAAGPPSQMTSPGNHMGPNGPTQGPPTQQMGPGALPNQGQMSSGPMGPAGPGSQMNQSGPPGPGGPPPGPPGQENLTALQRAIDTMEEKGLQQDPRYEQLLAMRASRQGNNLNDRPHAFSSQQVQQLRVQIMAYRMLARNQPLPQNILQAVQGQGNAYFCFIYFFFSFIIFSLIYLQLHLIPLYQKCQTIIW